MLNYLVWEIKERTRNWSRSLGWSKINLTWITPWNHDRCHKAPTGMIPFTLWIRAKPNFSTASSLLKDKSKINHSPMGRSEVNSPLTSLLSSQISMIHSKFWGTTTIVRMKILKDLRRSKSWRIWLILRWAPSLTNWKESKMLAAEGSWTVCWEKIAWPSLLQPWRPPSKFTANRWYIKRVARPSVFWAKCATLC